MSSKEIRCRCGKLLAKETDGVLEIMNGNKAVRVYGAVCVALDCPRCGKTTDLPRKLPLAVKQLGGI